MTAKGNKPDLAVTASEHERPGSLQHRLATTRKRYVVGREQETTSFRAILTTGTVSVIHLYGPGGIGKTTLLHEFVSLCLEHEALAVRLDACTIEPTPQGFLATLTQSLELEPSESPLEMLAAQSRRCVLLLDTYELLSPLDDWLRETLLPQLPANTLVVIAGRSGPSTGWRSDPSWRGLVQMMPLRNLRPDESYEFLSRRGISSERHDSLLAFSHGHPLALSLVADVLEQDASLTFTAEQFPNVVTALVERFIKHVPSPHHRLALETCAHTRVTSEALLRETVGEETAHDLFEWLRQLSFIEQSPEGLFPHDLAREVIDAALRWRDPDAYVTLHRRIHAHIIRHIHDTHGSLPFRASSDLIYLHRNNPVMRAFFDFSNVGRLHAETAKPDDHRAIVAMTERHEGEASAKLVAYWLERQPHVFWIVRGKAEPLGFLAHLALHEVTPEDLDTDAVVKEAVAYLARHAPLRPGETAQFARFAMAVASYQAPSPVFNALQVAQGSAWLTTSRLAWSLIYGVPDYEPLMRYIDFQQIPLSDKTSTPPKVCFAHDWRARPPEAWVELMGVRGLTTKMNDEDLEPPASTVIVLSEPEFAHAVKAAFREYHQPQALEKSPLLHSRLIQNPGTGKALQQLLRQGVETLTVNPKDEKFYRALNATYLEPAATREVAAERLGLPFGTYRYHLTLGLERVVAYLWQLELQTY